MCRRGKVGSVCPSKRNTVKTRKHNEYLDLPVLHLFFITGIWLLPGRFGTTLNEASSPLYWSLLWYGSYVSLRFVLY